jgi:hypothetical protein
MARQRCQQSGMRVVDTSGREQALNVLCRTSSRFIYNAINYQYITLGRSHGSAKLTNGTPTSTLIMHSTASKRVQIGHATTGNHCPWRRY